MEPQPKPTFWATRSRVLMPVSNCTSGITTEDYRPSYPEFVDSCVRYNVKMRAPVARWPGLFNLTSCSPSRNRGCGVSPSPQQAFLFRKTPRLERNRVLKKQPMTVPSLYIVSGILTGFRPLWRKDSVFLDLEQQALQCPLLALPLRPRFVAQNLHHPFQCSRACIPLKRNC